MNHVVTTALHALVLVFFVTAGCSSEHGEEGCPELCERTAQCPGSTGGEDACVSACRSTTEVVESAGCDEDWESFLECRSHATDACNEQSYAEECSVQYDSFRSCLAPYCKQHPDASECASSAP